MTAAQSLATFYVLPAVIALLGSYMICREEQEDTLKSLRLIPVDEVKLTLAKMILAFVFSVLIYLLLFAITFLVEAVLHLEAQGLALSSELFITGTLNTFARHTNVDTQARIIAYDIRELGEQLMPLGMLVTLDAIYNRVIQNWKKGRRTWIFCDEFYRARRSVT